MSRQLELVEHEEDVQRDIIFEKKKYVLYTE